MFLLIYVTVNIKTVLL